EKIDAWRTRPLTQAVPYVYLDGNWLKRSWGGEVRNVSILVAIAVAADGYRDVIGAMEGAKEGRESWMAFLKHLKERDLNGVRLVISDKCLGLVESIAEVFAAARWQRGARFELHVNYLEGRKHLPIVSLERVA